MAEGPSLNPLLSLSMHGPSSEPPPPSDSLGSLFRNRSFCFYTGSRVSAMVAMAVQTAIVAWQVYELTNSAASLAFLGVFQFLPSVVTSFLGGALADTRDRRVILGLASLVPVSTSLLLCVLTATQTISLTAIYACVAMVGLASAFEGPAQQSLLPQIVPRSSFQRAVAVSTTISQLARVH